MRLNGLRCRLFLCGIGTKFDQREILGDATVAAVALQGSNRQMVVWFSESTRPSPTLKAFIPPRIQTTLGHRLGDPCPLATSSIPGVSFGFVSTTEIDDSTARETNGSR